MTSNIEVELLSRPEAFDELREAWCRLSETAETSSVFMTWEWQSQWWQHYGRAGTLRVFVARQGLQVVGLLPMHVQRPSVLGPLSVRKLRQVGTGGDTSPDDLDPLLDPSCATQAAEALAEAVFAHQREWDVLEVVDCQPGSAFIQALSRISHERAGTTLDHVTATIPYGPLPSTYEDYLSGLSSNRRSILRRMRRKFEQQEGAGYRVVSLPAELDGPIDTLIALHRMRWQDRAASHAFSSTAYVNFHRGAIHALAQRDQIRLYCLELQGRTVAVYYCYRFRNGLYYFQGGFDTALSELRPGLVLMTKVIEDAIAQGCQIFDLLRGNYGHKHHWVKQTRDTVGLTAYRKGWPALAWRTKQALKSLRAKPAPNKSEAADDGDTA